jgi:thiol-disulfide isomerase/thioredoxin
MFNVSDQPQRGIGGRSHHDGVKNLTPTDFDDNLKITQLKHAPEKGMLIVFYANWCPHCKSILDQRPNGEPSELENLASLASRSNFDVAKIDCATFPNYFSKCREVQGYPTIYFYGPDGKMSERAFRGNRTANDLLAWMESCHSGTCA